jgi:predicted AAA+ superfamily ATPase
MKESEGANLMVYLRRKIDTYLQEWKNQETRKPLVVKGARQVGKTESILHFAKTAYQNIKYINFVEEPFYKQIIADGYSTDAILKNVSRIDPAAKFVPGQTIFIFDELQEFPEISTALKFFAIDGKYDVICSGSMLGINYKIIESNSVGYKIDYEMHSMDFEEFLWAKGYEDDFIENIFSHMHSLTPFNELELSICNSLFTDYCTLGGMPSIIRDYILKGTFEGSLQIQRQLLIDYKEDIQKYADGMDQARILNVFNQIPVQLAKDNKKFQISKVAKGATFKDYRGCIEWLEQTGLINICYCLNFPELPLKGNYESTKYKIYFADTGLLIAMLDDEAQIDLRANRNFGVYKGALYENVVAEALVKEGYHLYYYRKTDSTLEEDFFVRTASELVPLEVKSQNSKSKSLRMLIDSDHYPEIHFGIKLIGGNIGKVNNVITFPYFCTFLLKKYLSSGKIQ